MAREAVITSVPRGVKLGRTGFQVVMRTAGTPDGLLDTLEQLAGYRHVHPPGSGLNPVNYGYRIIRSPAGQLLVLGRTLDAGIDFSSRSNKLAHLLAVDTAEISSLRISSPAAVLAAIEGQLARTWNTGPETKVSAFPLPTIPVHPAACRRWNELKGDAGWGGLLAQRAARGQATLVVAPDCSPGWSLRLLELFQEVLAILPPDIRWRTSFETSVVGSSSSLLRGTYVGSPESTCGLAGLLVVDLSQRAAVPANVAPDELITTAREGPKRIQLRRGPPTLVSLGTTDTGETNTVTRLAPADTPRPAIRTGPSKPPVSWSDASEDDQRSALGWYIGGGTVLLGLILVSVLLGGWHWWDTSETKRLQQKVGEYANGDDGNKPDTSDALTLGDWQRAFRDDDKDAKDRPSEKEFPLLLSALRTKRIESGHINDKDKRHQLVADSRAIVELPSPEEEKLLDAAERLGLDLPEGLEGKHRQAAAKFLAGWLADNKLSWTPTSAAEDFDTLRQRIQLAIAFTKAALHTTNSRVTELQDHASKIWGNADGNANPKWPDLFAEKVSRDNLEFKQISWFLADAREPPENNTSNADPTTSAGSNANVDPGKPPDAELQKLSEQIKKYNARPPADCEKVVLADGVDLSAIKLQVELASCGSWKPVADCKQTNKKWDLLGLPDDGPDQKTLWGTISVESGEKSDKLIFKRHPNTSNDALYVPIRLAAGAAPIEVVVLAEQENTEFKTEAGQTLYDLVESGSLCLTPNDMLSITSIPAEIQNGIVTTFHDPGKDGLSFSATPMGGMNGIAVTLTADWGKCASKPAPKKEQLLTDVWLDSFTGTVASEQGALMLVLKCDDRGFKPWTQRYTRLLNGSGNALPSGNCSVDEWKKTVDKVLQNSPYDNLKGPKGQTADTFVEAWLGKAPSNPSDRSLRYNHVNNLDRGGVPAWYEEAWRHLCGSPEYKTHTRNRARKEVVIELGQQPPQEDVDKHGIWNKRLDEVCSTMLNTSRNVKAFLDTESSKSLRAAGVVVLELAAKDAAPKASESMKAIPLASLFDVTLDLNWKFPGGELKRVRRFTIKKSSTSASPKGSATAGPESHATSEANDPSAREQN